MDDIDIKILKAMAPGGTMTQDVREINKQLRPPLDRKELQERLERLAGTTRYVKDEGQRHSQSTGIEFVTLTEYGLKFVRENK
jgi:hypothetical protein